MLKAITSSEWWGARKRRHSSKRHLIILRVEVSFLFRILLWPGGGSSQPRLYTHRDPPCLEAGEAAACWGAEAQGDVMNGTWLDHKLAMTWKVTLHQKDKKLFPLPAQFCLKLIFLHLHGGHLADAFVRSDLHHKYIRPKSETFCSISLTVQSY